jgi:hypothetical protein
MSTKAIEMAQDLVDELKIRVKSTLPVVTESSDSNGNPVITLSADATPAAGEKVVVLRIKPIDWALAKDVLGLASAVHTPHEIEICTEANFAGTTDNVADILTPVELLPVLLTVGVRGTRVKWYQSANATVPATGEMTSGNLKATFESSLYFGMKASQ